MNIFVSILFSQLNQLYFLKLIQIIFSPGLCCWRYHHWCLVGTHLLVCSVYCFPSCTFYVDTKKKNHMKTRVSLKYFLNDCLWKQFFAFNSLQTFSNLISWPILVSLRPFTQFYSKIRAIKLQKSAKICLTW